MYDLIATYPLGMLGAFIAVYFLLDRLMPNVMNVFEETVISIILALMVLVAFVQVILRYGFNTGITGALELNRILFAWLILFGMSYGLKIGTHLGIDSLMRVFPKPVFKALALFGALAALLWAVILIHGTWLTYIGATSRGGGAVDYWVRFFKLPLGLDDLVYPSFLREFAGQERVHRWVAYIILPIGLALFAMRALQGVIDIALGKRDLIIASHEAEDLVNENKDILRD
ncbi:TRAP transporter small permease [Acuticoccus yangtzensis]|uniref:TRAP transporter small permease n=1 Tax=Acuticoccus yangtzensis TaxID=1443441 RepID=UPI0009F7F8E2|nr:TRAP transporter small permease [Acuticoccus yangtzensis]ORE94144.1 TRAP-type C4-dicarboxylate transporter, small permease [Stappia sp. 22II-S9-Z10]